MIIVAQPSKDGARARQRSKFVKSFSRRPVMTATQKIDGLVNSWYGYAVFGAALNLWNQGIGLWSLITTAAGFIFSIMLTWFLGNRLKNKSSLWRLILVVGSALMSVVGGIGVAKMGWTFIHTFSLSVLLYAGIAAVHVFMNAKSFRVLTDKSVKAYFNGA
jgi:hypothetical protein